jgi:hypothetical protein
MLSAKKLEKPASRRFAATMTAAHCGAAKGTDRLSSLKELASEGASKMRNQMKIKVFMDASAM